MPPIPIRSFAEFGEAPVERLQVSGQVLQLRPRRGGKETGINRVALSGGVFQNRLLLKESKELLYKEGFEVLLHMKLSCNDSSISLGQAAIASFRR